MSESKTYYWLKLNENFFSDETISYIEEQENGIAYSNFYLKLCLKSIRTEGKLMRLVGNMLIPYDVPSIAKLVNVPVDTVAVAMQLFERIGLVERLDTGEIYLSQINEMVGKETDKAAIMRRKRAEQKLLGDKNIEGNIVTPMLPECYPEIEKDKEKDIDIDTEIEKEQPDDKRPTPSIRIPYEKVKSLYNDICKSFPKCTTLSDARKKAIRARFVAGYTIDDFNTAFTKAEASPFLKGQNNRNWTATFDWMLKDANFVKILDGNYDDHHQAAEQPQRIGDLDDLF